MKDFLEKVVLVFLVVISLTAATSAPIQSEMEFRVMGCENVFYIDQFNQKQKMMNGHTYSGDTKIIIGESPKSVTDKGTPGRVLFANGYYLESEEEGGKFYQLEGTIFDLIFVKYLNGLY